MTKREAIELLPTMKAKADENDELAIVFEAVKVKLVSFTDLKTGFGDKIIAVVNDGKKDFNLFVNVTSLNKLIEAYGDDDEKWIGKTANLTLETNEKFKSKMIVINPIK